MSADDEQNNENASIFSVHVQVLYYVVSTADSLPRLQQQHKTPAADVKMGAKTKFHSCYLMLR
jgi:LysM repeat protein